MPPTKNACGIGPEGLQRASSLTSHKTLPRPPAKKGLSSLLPPMIDDSTRNGKARSTSSPISRPSQNKTTISPAPKRSPSALPPTPPLTAHRSSEGLGHQRTTSRRRHGKSPSQELSTPTTQSLPTPDTTPPRAALGLSVHHSPAELESSSRADSFKTAREQQTDGESVPAVSPFIHGKRGPISSMNGLGVDCAASMPQLESDEETASTTPTRKPRRKEFTTFDGEWRKQGKPELNVDLGKEWNAINMRNVTVRKRGHQAKKPSLPHAQEFSPQAASENKPNPTSEVLRSVSMQEKSSQATPPSEVGNKAKRSVSLKEKPAQLPEKKEMQASETAEVPVTWPKMIEDIFLNNNVDTDTRRFSGLSGTSTVISAIVVDQTPQRQRTLRHTGQNLALRERNKSSKSDLPPRKPIPPANDSTSLSKREQEISRRSHKSLSSKMSSRSSIVSNSIPVVVIPQRRSSLKSSRSSSVNQRSTSLTSNSIHSAREEDGCFGLRRHKRRTYSDPASPSFRTENNRGREHAPIIPQRSSSLSAPTSRNVSRAASVSSQGRVPLQLAKPEVKEVGQHSPKKISEWGPADFLSIGHLSAPITPISQLSNTSKTPEALQATAINLYPHHNESVLIIEQQAVKSPEVPQTPSAAVKALDFPSFAAGGQSTPLLHGLSSSPKIARLDESLFSPPDPVTTPIGRGIFSSHQVDSPLKNPRNPPMPPALKLIPPTPALATPSIESGRQLGHSNALPSDESPKPVRRLSLLRRTFSNRRHSESLTTSFAKSIGIDEGTQTADDSAHLSRRGEHDSSKLHPFWRPQGFWDDLSDSDDDERFDGGSGRSSLSRQPLRRSSTLRSLFAILPQAESRVVRRRRSSAASIASEPRLSVASTTKITKRRVRSVSGMGMQIEYIGLRGLRDRVRAARNNRRERKRDLERAKLRTMIRVVNTNSS
ncbi:MAG: hypothetical protein M1829_006027 [Trizodia sp. TS-e1964]|nr:MAG: hypothetical protein M1829_006027 [Trizodia sp. TS-e1964]